LPDNRPPSILGVYLVGADNRAVAGAKAPGLIIEAPPGRYDLVVDLVDEIPPGQWGDSVYAFDAALGGRLLGSVRFDQLPETDFLKGVDRVYRLEPFTALSGEEISNQFELDRPRHFLLHLPLDTTGIASASPLPLVVRAVDFAGNETHLSSRLLSR
jgi:hypothetical protein